MHQERHYQAHEDGEHSSELLSANRALNERRTASARCRAVGANLWRGQLVRIVEGVPVFSPSDLTGYLACDHLLTLELRAMVGDLCVLNAMTLSSRSTGESDLELALQFRPEGLVRQAPS